MPATLHGPARTGEFPSGLAIVVICSFVVPGSLCQEGGKTQRTDCQIRDFVSPAIFFLKTCNCQKMYQHLTCLTCLFNQSPGMTYSDSFRLSWRLCITANPLFFLDCGATLETSEARTEHTSFEAF